MTGCVALRKDIYYIRLTYYDREQKCKDKWVSTGLSGRGAQKKATAKLEDSKARIKLTKPEIIRFINKAIHKEPAQMIRSLVKK